MDIFKSIEKFIASILGYDWFEPFTIVLLAVLASFLSRKIINFAFGIRKKAKKIKRSEERLKRNETISKIAKTAVDIVIWMTAAMNFLSSIGVNVASLMTGAGLIGVVVGLGAQTTTRDILAGFFIVGENQYRVGDTIEIMVGGRLISGKVENISLRITQVRDADGKVHTIRNGASEAVTNLSFKYANVNLLFGVSYDTDIDTLEEVINGVGRKMLENPELKKNIIEPIEFVRVNKFLDSSMEIKCLGRVKAGKQWDVAGIFRREIKKAFDENDIVLPYPQMVIHDINRITAKDKANKNYTPNLHNKNNAKKPEKK